MSRRHCGHGSRATGSTLVEMLVVLAILGLLMGMTGLAFQVVGNLPPVDPLNSRISAARSQAVRSGRSVTVTLETQNRTVAATAYPDGSVVADTSLGVDRLSGRIAR